MSGAVRALFLLDWLPWEPLSNCKLANGACLSYRLRNCSTGSDNDCDGSNHDIVPCKPDDCIPSKKCIHERVGSVWSTAV